MEPPKEIEHRKSRKITQIMALLPNSEQLMHPLTPRTRLPKKKQNTSIYYEIIYSSFQSFNDRNRQTQKQEDY